MIYAGLLLSAFTSATLLPGSSEAALLVLLAAGSGHPVLLVVAATIGNVLGSTINWSLGRFLFHLRDRPWFPFGPDAYGWAICRFQSYGFWLLFLSWVPVIGDPLTLAAGILRIPFPLFILIVSVGKAARYVALLVAFTGWSN